MKYPIKVCVYFSPTKKCLYFEHASSRTSLSAGWLSFFPPEKERYSRFLRFSLFMDIAVL